MPPKNKFSILAVLWFAIAWYGLMKESSGSPPPFPHFDKVAHCGLFFTQIWLLARSYIETPVRPIPYRSLLIFALLFATVSEIAQAWLTRTRSGDPLDALADMAGTAFALLLARNVAHNRSTLSKPIT